MAKPVGAETADELREITGKIFVLCCPWKLWTVSGPWIASTPAGGGTIAGTDAAGREILSIVPPSIVQDFLSGAGQEFVSCPKPHRIFFVLITNPNDPQVYRAMSTIRSSHINRLRSHGSMIFGREFEQALFPSRFDRGSIAKFQELLGVRATPVGKKYPLLPPILFPNGSTSKARDIFLNPALVRVSTFSSQASTIPTKHRC